MSESFPVLPANNLKKLRNHIGLSQEELCIKLRKHNCYISRSNYSKYETGSRYIPIDVLVCFSCFFKVSTDYILGLTNNPQQNET